MMVSATAGACSTAAFLRGPIVKAAFLLNQIKVHANPKDPEAGKIRLRGRLDGNYISGGMVNDLINSPGGLEVTIRGDEGVIDTLSWLPAD